MSDNMYDKRGFLKPEYAALAESQKKTILINNNIKKIDHRTNFGKGFVYKSVDGGEHDSMESVERVNKAYFDSRIIDNTSRKDYARYVELEKAYFDCITPKFNNNDKDMIQQVLTAQQEKFVAYIKERYANYLSEILERFSYDKQDYNRSPKK